MRGFERVLKLCLRNDADYVRRSLDLPPIRHVRAVRTRATRPPGSSPPGARTSLVDGGSETEAGGSFDIVVLVGPSCGRFRHDDDL